METKEVETMQYLDITALPVCEEVEEVDEIEEETGFASYEEFIEALGGVTNACIHVVNNVKTFEEALKKIRESGVLDLERMRASIDSDVITLPYHYGMYNAGIRFAELQPAVRQSEVELETSERLQRNQNITYRPLCGPSRYWITALHQENLPDFKWE